jgi:hypothetical protein
MDLADADARRETRETLKPTTPKMLFVCFLVSWLSWPLPMRVDRLVRPVCMGW